MKKYGGANRAEANISSVAAMLLDISLRVYEFQRKKRVRSICNISMISMTMAYLEPEEFNKMLMDNVLKTACASTILLQIVGNIN